MLSVIDPSVPEVVDSATVAPPLVRLFPLTSFNWTVTVEVEVPLAVMLEGDAVIVDVVTDAGPGVKATVAVSVIAVPPKVPLTVAVPAVVLEVSVAV